MAKSMYVGEFLKMVKDLEEATDKHGVRLYDDTAIASFFGFDSENRLKTEIRKARDRYRTEMQKKASELKEKGLDNDKIAEQMGISTTTVELLLDADGRRRTENVKDLEKQRQEFFDKMQKDFRESQKETEKLSKELGWDKLFGFNW